MGTGTYTGTGTGTTKTLGKTSSEKKRSQKFQYVPGPSYYNRIVKLNQPILVWLLLVWVSPSVVCVRQETPLFCTSGLQSTALFFRLFVGEGRRAAESLSDRGSFSGTLGWETRLFQWSAVIWKNVLLQNCIKHKDITFILNAHYYKRMASWIAVKLRPVGQTWPAVSLYLVCRVLYTHAHVPPIR